MKKKREHNKESTLIYDGKSSVETVLTGKAARLDLIETIGLHSTMPYPTEALDGNNGTGSMLVSGDNIGVLRRLIKLKEAGQLTNGDGTEGVRLIYIDPPFSTLQTYKTKNKQTAYEDHLTGADFIEFLRTSLILLRQLLAENGSIYVHLDWNMAFHIRVVMDELFGAKNFLNDIIWHYGGRGAKAISRQFSRNHDTLLLYRSKSHIFNRLYTKKLIDGKNGVQRDSNGRAFKTAPRGDYTDESIKRLDAEGRIHRTKNGTIRIKYFLETTANGVLDNKLVGDVWDDIPDAMHMAGSEKSGYPTQKPEALLARIISASSNPGDLVLDAFSGSGTTLVVAEKLNRRWIGIDSGEPAIKTTKKRLKNLAGSKSIENSKKEYSKECTPYRFFKAIEPL